MASNRNLSPQFNFAVSETKSYVDGKDVPRKDITMTDAKGHSVGNMRFIPMDDGTHKYSETPFGSEHKKAMYGYAKSAGLNPTKGEHWNKW